MRLKRRISQVTLLATVLTLASAMDAPPTGASSKTSKAGPRKLPPRIREHVTYASWYGWQFARRRTASGEPFNPMALTAAHKTLPLGSRVRVTNLKNGRSVVVRINDRGPYHGDRGIDVSKEAARQLRMVSAGVAKVKLEELPVMKYNGPVPTAMAAWPSSQSGARALSL